MKRSKIQNAFIGLILFATTVTTLVGESQAFASCPDTFAPIDSSKFRSQRLEKPAKNIILMIGDGFGPVQLQAAQERFEAEGMTDPFRLFPYSGKVTHCSLTGITDSAAAGTAMATGLKTFNKMISIAPKNPAPETILEISQSLGKKTGLVTNTSILHATPAVFAAHEKARKNYAAIARDYLEEPMPDLLLGGGRTHFVKIGLREEPRYKPYRWQGFRVVEDWRGLERVMEKGKNKPVLGLFADTDMTWELDRVAPANGGREPSLSQMSDKALGFLSRGENGFFLMIEGGRIDHAGHANHINRLIPEVGEFAKTVSLVFQWASKHPGTLLLVTADHETGGLTKGKGGYYWTTDDHTATPVFIWGTGPNADTIKPIQDNRAVFHIMHQSLMPSDVQSSEYVSH